jgi:hypothetical protein
MTTLGGIGPPTHGASHYSTEAPVSNHQNLNLDILVLECYLLGSLKYKRTQTFDNYKMQLGIVKKYFEKAKIVVILF